LLYDGALTRARRAPRRSRNSEDNSKKYPDIAACVPRLLKPGVRSVVLDCEAVAFDRELGKILPFQARPGARALGQQPGRTRCPGLHARCLHRFWRLPAPVLPCGVCMPLLMSAPRQRDPRIGHVAKA